MIGVPKMPSYALWSIWHKLPVLHRLFFLVLSVVGFYSLVWAAKILVGARTVTRPGEAKDLALLQDKVAALSARSASVRHLITATFYLFGIVFFWGLRSTLWTPDSNKFSVGWLVLNNFFLHFAFAANVFVIFFILHSVQWLASARLDAHTRRLNARRIEHTHPA
jgi:hypothetical protein